jgi:PhzF family phenazine biosynthesis protein
MDLPIFIIDAFADRPFTGNPAAVCPLDAWLPVPTMQAIASEMNLSETVFFAPDPQRGGFCIRWFTPTREVDLIGHATLAAGLLVLKRLQPGAASVRFRATGTASLLRCRRSGRKLSSHRQPLRRDWAERRRPCSPRSITSASSIIPTMSRR